MAGLGRAGHGKERAWLGAARLGLAWRGKARRWPGRAGLGLARPGKAGQGKDKGKNTTTTMIGGNPHGHVRQ